MSLMKDQVDALQANGIAAEFINSSQSREEILQVFARLRRGELKLLYVAPERLLAQWHEELWTRGHILGHVVNDTDRARMQAWLEAGAAGLERADDDHPAARHRTASALLLRPRDVADHPDWLDPVRQHMLVIDEPQSLPRDVLDAEMQRIADMGVTVQLNAKVFDIEKTMKDGGFDAAFLAVGAHIAKRAYIPAKDSSRILDAVQVLRSMEGEEQPMLGRRVVVYGGGNTAIDVARTAKRLGATEAIIVYRRTREKMPAHDFEVEEALQEGVLVKWLSTIREAGESSITVEKMELDAKGNPQPTGQFETLEADSVVLALGQDVDLSLLENVPGLSVNDGVVQVDAATMMTGHPGLFAGGDMVPAERTVTVAIGHGKKAARHIDAWLRGETWVHPPSHELASFDKLNTWYYSDAPKSKQPVLDTIRRQSTFEEVVGSFDETTAQFEARRCLSCGNCFECDNCYGVCPDNAVIKLGPGNRFSINLDYCKGCGICVAECPCGAIEMVPEET